MSGNDTFEIHQMKYHFPVPWKPSKKQGEWVYAYYKVTKI